MVRPFYLTGKPWLGLPANTGESEFLQTIPEVRLAETEDLSSL